MRNIFSPYPYSVWKHFTLSYAERVRQLIGVESFDLIHCEWLPYARYLQYTPGVPGFVDLHNIETQILNRRAEHCSTHLAAYFFRMQARKMEQFEKSVLAGKAQCATVSETDRKQAVVLGARDAVVVENGVDLDFFQPAANAYSRPELLLIGSLDWFPNQDAAKWFMRDILPLVRAKIPDVVLTIVGRRPPQFLVQFAAAQAGVTLVGEVDDVRPYFDRAALVVVPLHVGGGTRIKILEAMAMGKAVVSTPVGAEGLFTVNDTCIRLADGAAAFAAAVIRLMNQAEERTRIGYEGRQMVTARYGWDRQAAVLDIAWKRAAGVVAPAEVTQ
jgi:glycosyltransferase involved in cell wall biosynthesis